MRKVLFSIYEEGKWSDNKEGEFHQWGSSFEVIDNQAVPFTYAIIEDVFGKVHEVAPNKVHFLN